jgi:3-oxoacyl-[acyl-carrier-protein] synthase III
MFQSKITGTGFYVPDNIVTNADLTQIMDTTDEWIQERTGIQERRWIIPGSGDTASVMGAKAARKAIANAGLTKDDIDFIIFATLSPDYYFPGGGVQVQHLLEMPTIGALDVRNQCTGFVYGLSVADQFIKTGMYKNILVIGAEYHSNGLDKTTRGRTVAVLFGDGAGAVVLSRSEKEGSGILTSNLHSQGEFAEQLAVTSPSIKHWIPELMANPDDLSYFPYMDGQLVFKHAITRFTESIEEALAACQLKTEDVNLFIPHQANLRISQMVQRKFRFADNQVFNNIQKYGNTTAATLPIALSEALEQDRIKEGDIVILSAFGSGFTWGSVVLRW